MKRIALLAALGLGACSTGETITLAKEGSQDVVCGPYEAFGGRDEARAMVQLRTCVEDFQRQGYERKAP